MINLTNLKDSKKKVIYAKVLTALAAVVAGVALPQIFHLIGRASGLGSSLGASLLPMHLSVLIAGLTAGPLAGLTAGLLSPVLSFGLSGMPTLILLPFMTIELAFYGLISGLLKKSKMPVIVKLLTAQIGGRLIRAAAIVIAIFGFGSKGIAIQAAWNIVVIGLPGIILQWALIPLLSYRLKGLNRFYE